MLRRKYQGVDAQMRGRIVKKCGRADACLPTRLNFIAGVHVCVYGQFSTVQFGKLGPAPGRFELSKGMLM